MVFSSLRTGGLSLLILFFAATSAFSQSSKRYDEKRVSITASGGVTLGDLNTGNYFFASNLSVNTKNTTTFGAGVQYALTPKWSLELGYSRLAIAGLDAPFTVSVDQVRIKNMINLNQLLDLNEVRTRLNPYITVGVGYEFYNYREAGEHISGESTAYNFGAGLAYRLTNTYDLFTNYEYTVSTNAIDNEVGGYGADLINTLTAGVRLNFGKAETRLSSWRDAPLQFNIIDCKQLVESTSAISDLKQRVDLLETQGRSQEPITNTVFASDARIDSLAARLSNVENDIIELRDLLIQLQSTSQSRGIGAETVKALTGIMPRGHYVQIFASKDLQIAEDVRQQLSHDLVNVFSKPDENIILIKRKAFYEVLIGVFPDYTNARELLDLIKLVQSDAFIISFPRPLNLKSDLDGLKIIDHDDPASNEVVTSY